jgi:hypothetical protein
VPGDHTFSIRATDALGNLATDVFTWKVDQTPPQMNAQGLPRITKSSTVNFTINSSEPLVTGDEDGLGGCALDGLNLWRACSGPISFTGLADGQHTYTVEGIDRAFNVSSPANFPFTVDTTAPVVTFTSGPPNPTTSRSATLEWTAQDLTPVTYKCKLDTAPAQPCNSPVTRNNLSPGQHTFTVTGTDAAGNVGQPVGWTWTITS